jgi:hypothetical protein
MNTMPTTLREDAEKFAQFIVENYPDAKQWHEPVQKAAWYIAHAFVASVLGDEGEIVALCAARPVDRPGIGVLPYYYNDAGRDLHVDLWCDVSEDDRARQVLKLFFQWRFPQCTTITMFRHFEEHLRTYPIKKFWRSFEKIRHVKRKRKTHELVTT